MKIEESRLRERGGRGKGEGRDSGGTYNSITKYKLSTELSKTSIN